MFLSATRRDDKTFPGIHEDDIPVLENLVDRNIQVYKIFFDEQSEMFTELTRRSCLKRAQITSLLRYEIISVGQRTSTSSSKNSAAT